jgi:hypothetical protein
MIYSNCCVPNKNTGFDLIAFLRVKWHLRLLNKLSIAKRNGGGGGTAAGFPPSSTFPS